MLIESLSFNPLTANSTEKSCPKANAFIILQNFKLFEFERPVYTTSPLPLISELLSNFEGGTWVNFCRVCALIFQNPYPIILYTLTQFWANLIHVFPNLITVCFFLNPSLPEFFYPKMPKMCNSIPVYWKCNPIIVNPVVKIWLHPGAYPH